MKTRLAAFFAIINLKLCHCGVLDTVNTLSQLKKLLPKVADLYEKLEGVNAELKEKDEITKSLQEKMAFQELTANQHNCRLTELEKRQAANETAAITVVRKDRQEETVAFTAYLDNELTNLGPDHIIQFGGVELNEGNAYNNHTGVFTVPVDWLYLFSFSVEDYRKHRLWTKLVVDNQLKASVVEWPAGQNAHGSNTAVLRLKTGQSVWVAIDSRESGDSLQGWADLRPTMFTGVLLHP